MIKGITYITEKDPNEPDYESMGINKPVNLQDAKEVDFYFRAEEVYNMLNIDKDLYMVEFRDDTNYVIKLTKDQVRKIVEE